MGKHTIHRANLPYLYVIQVWARLHLPIRVLVRIHNELHRDLPAGDHRESGSLDRDGLLQRQKPLKVNRHEILRIHLEYSIEQIECQAFLS